MYDIYSNKTALAKAGVMYILDAVRFSKSWIKHSHSGSNWSCSDTYCSCTKHFTKGISIMNSSLIVQNSIYKRG